MTDRYAGYREFVDSRGGALLRTACLLTGDRTEAEDALQDALVKAAMKWPRINRDGNPEPYVRQILYTVTIDRWRWRNRRAPEQLGISHDRAVEGDPGGDVDRRLMVSAALAKLTPRQRQVLVLRFYEDRTESQTAQTMRCSVSTVKSQTRLALQRLRELAPELAEAVGAVPLENGTQFENEVRA
ncbi:MAG TPA: SigE family RNA polymerase sigma factor [Actinomycetes bacterium]|nr:SigE family RNA polymerase sigma factor [Actinomycetes bacterium]